MTPEFVISFAKEAIWLTILISAPLLGVGLVVGLLVSIFQAVTSIQEMTLSFVPKILAVFLTMMILAPWMTEKIMTYATRVFTEIPLHIR